MIFAVVLAAGESRRMGRQKLLLPFGETTIIGAVVRTALASRAGGVMVVLGADRAAIRAELGSLEVEDAERTGPSGQAGRAGREGMGQRGRVAFAVNDDYRLGMLTSIQAGIRALPAEAEAAVIVLGDQPFLAPRVIDAVIGAYEKGGAGIVIPTFKGRRGHPVLVDLGYRGEILAFDAVDGLRKLMLAHPGDILEADVADPGILRDLDTPEDYAGLPKPN